MAVTLSFPDLWTFDTVTFSDESQPTDLLHGDAMWLVRRGHKAGISMGGFIEINQLMICDTASWKHSV